MARPTGFALNRHAWDDVLRLSGLDLPRVADLADVPPSTLRTITNGHRNASIPMAHKLAAAVGCRPETLFPALIPAPSKQAA